MVWWGVCRGSLPLFMLVPSCVWFCVCVCMFVEIIVCVCVCVCVCVVRLGCRLLLWFSGSARGVGVAFSPSLSSICRGRGWALAGPRGWLLEQCWARSAPIRGRCGRWRPGQLSRCCYSASPGSGLSEGQSLKGWHEGEHLEAFLFGRQIIHIHKRMLIIPRCSAEGHMHIQVHLHRHPVQVHSVPSILYCLPNLNKL